MRDTPDEISISPGLGAGGSWYPLELAPEWDGTRYVRKELYDALKARVEELSALREIVADLQSRSIGAKYDTLDGTTTNVDFSRTCKGEQR